MQRGSCAAWVTRAYGAGLDPRVAALSEGRLTLIPPIEGYADVADVLAAWTPKDWDVPPHLWGPPPPPEFLDNKEPPA